MGKRTCSHRRHEMAVIRSRIWFVVGWPLADHRGQIMQRLTSAQLFAAPKRAGKTKARLERAKLVIVAARERAAETAQQCAAQPSTMRPPTVLQRRRLVGRFSEKFWRGGGCGPSTSSSLIASARSSEHEPPARPK